METEMKMLLTGHWSDLIHPNMQALSLIPEKLRQRRRLRQRVLDTVSPRTAFANPKYGSTSRNFIFRVMASRKIAPSPMPGAAVVPKVNVDGTRTTFSLVQ